MTENVHQILREAEEIVGRIEKKTRYKKLYKEMKFDNKNVHAEAKREQTRCEACEG